MTDFFVKVVFEIIAMKLSDSQNEEVIIESFLRNSYKIGRIF